MVVSVAKSHHGTDRQPRRKAEDEKNEIAGKVGIGLIVFFIGMCGLIMSF